jgi:hypothetical protein
MQKELLGLLAAAALLLGALPQCASRADVVGHSAKARAWVATQRDSEARVPMLPPTAVTGTASRPLPPQRPPENLGPPQDIPARWKLPQTASDVHIFGAQPRESARTVLPQPSVQTSAAYALGGSMYWATGGGHWIEEVTSDGGVIILEDDSVWSVSALDQVETSLWLPISNVMVVDGSDPGYPYLLINTDDGEKAEAFLLGLR